MVIDENVDTYLMIRRMDLQRHPLRTRLREWWCARRHGRWRSVIIPDRRLGRLPAVDYCEKCDTMVPLSRKRTP